mmetsp:Transcript_7861/g.12481  ORF Transcript_7861/g.12481 Transcript_7861/m.12481 type:complete len:207 (+) Transcript_7861:238-858(+)
MLAWTLSPTLKRSSFVTRQALKHSLNHSWSRFLPMKTKMFSRSPSGIPHFMSEMLPLKSMPTPWKMNFSSTPLIARIPLYLYRLAPSSWINLPIHFDSIAWFTLPLMRQETDDTVESCSCSASSSRKSGSKSSTRLSSNAWMLRSSLGLTLAVIEQKHGKTSATIKLSEKFIEWCGNKCRYFGWDNLTVLAACDRHGRIELSEFCC